MEAHWMWRCPWKPRRRRSGMLSSFRVAKLPSRHWRRAAMRRIPEGPVPALQTHPAAQEEALKASDVRSNSGGKKRRSARIAPSQWIEEEDRDAEPYGRAG